IEIQEIRMFVEEMENAFGVGPQMSSCVPQLIAGVAVFSEGLLKDVKNRAYGEGVDYDAATIISARKVGEFLELLENKHQELKVQFGPRETMKLAVEWIRENSLEPTLK